MQSKKITLSFPLSVFSAFKKTPEEFSKEIRLAAVVKWYEMGEIYVAIDFWRQV